MLYDLGQGVTQDYAKARDFHHLLLAGFAGAPEIKILAPRRKQPNIEDF